MKLTVALLALLTAGMGMGWFNSNQTAADEALKAQAAITEAEAEAEAQSVRDAFQYLSKYGKAIAQLQAVCREREGSSLKAAMFVFQQDGTPAGGQVQCHPRRTGT